MARGKGSSEAAAQQLPEGRDLSRWVVQERAFLPLPWDLGMLFRPVANLVRHVVLRLTMICHPHTGEKLAAALNDCLVDWGIEAGKVMMIVSDNGSNMIKAIQLLKDMNVDDACSDDETGTGSDDEDLTEDEASESDQDDEVTVA